MEGALVRMGLREGREVIRRGDEEGCLEGRIVGFDCHFRKNDVSSSVDNDSAGVGSGIQG